MRHHDALKTIALLLSLFFIPPFSPLADTYGYQCPKRIVSLNLASDEILVDLVDKNRIAGVTFLADKPIISSITDKVVDIPGKVRANLEEIVALEPDLVIIAKFSHPDFIKQLHDANIRTLHLEHFESIEGIGKTIDKIGKAVCEVEKAKQIKENMFRELKEIEARIQNGREKSREKSREKPRVLYYSPAGFTAGANSIVNDMIEYAGGINVVSESGLVGNQKISLEFIIHSDPEIIVMSSYSPDKPEFAKSLLQDSVIKEVRAVRTGRVYVLKDKYLIGGSHYVVDGVRKLSELFYPE